MTVFHPLSLIDISTRNRKTKKHIARILVH